MSIENLKTKKSFIEILSRAYRSISYTLDGNYLLAGGRSKYISLYNIQEQILVKRFEITCNKSFDGLNVRFTNSGK